MQISESTVIMNFQIKYFDFFFACLKEASRLTHQSQNNDSDLMPVSNYYYNYYDDYYNGRGDHDRQEMTTRRAVNQYWDKWFSDRSSPDYQSFANRQNFQNQMANYLNYQPRRRVTNVYYKDRPNKVIRRRKPYPRSR